MARFMQVINIAASVLAIIQLCLGKYEIAAFSWLLSEFARVRVNQHHILDKLENLDQPWPWCEPCQSYHHPKNTSCKAHKESQQ